MKGVWFVNKQETPNAKSVLGHNIISMQRDSISIRKNIVGDEYYVNMYFVSDSVLNYTTICTGFLGIGTSGLYKWKVIDSGKMEVVLEKTTSRKRSSSVYEIREQEGGLVITFVD